MSANGEQLILENEAENGGTGNEIGTPMLDGLMIADNEQDMQTAKGNDEESNGKGNEEKKIFCGGISYDTTGEDLNAYFTQFGAVKEAQVKYDRLTGRSRGFAFVEFESIDGCKASLVSREQMIKGKQCEIKPAKTREIGYLNKKVFVGGLPGDFPEEELRKHFEQFGRVDEIEWPFDKMSKTRKNFCFVCFDSEESADRAASNPKQQFANRECDIKKAVPQNKRGGANSMLFSPRIGGNSALRGAFAGGMVASGMRNNVANHQMYQNPWYNAAYNGGAVYGYGSTAASSAAVSGGGSTSAAQWYNSAGNNATTAAQANQWYNWYNNSNGNAGTNGANGDANGSV